MQLFAVGQAKSLLKWLVHTVDLFLLVAAEAASSIELMNHNIPCTVKKKLVNAPNERK